MEGISNRKLNGGISRIILIPSSEAVVGMRNKQLYCEVPASAVGCVPDEDTATWTERYTITKGVAGVAHTLEFVVAMDSPVVALLEQAEQGFVAVVEYRNGTKILAGHSSKFALERPLQVDLLTVTSGATRTDDAECRIRLGAVDDAFARSVTLL